MLPALLHCLSFLSVRRAAGVIRRVARRAAPGVGAAAPRVARRAAMATGAIRLGGLACLMGPLLTPSPAMGPLDRPPGVVAPAGGGAVGAGLGDIGSGDIGSGGIGSGWDAPGAPPAFSGSGLMDSAAGVTGFETRTIPLEQAEAPPPRRVVAVPEPASALLFVTGLLALLWGQRRRHAASGLDGAGDGR